MKPATPSTTVKNEKTTQYVSHCVASSVVPLFEDVSMDLKDMYAGYRNPSKSVTSLNPPATTVKMEISAAIAKKKYALGYPVFSSSSFKRSALENKIEGGEVRAEN